MISALVALPEDLDAACRLRGERPELTVVAGGTDVMVPVNEGTAQPAGWLSLRRLGALRRVDLPPAAAWTLGSGVTWARLLAPDVAAGLPALAAAARTVGSPQIRAAGTLGGNIATASPAGDSLPALLVHDAEVELASVAGRRRLPLADLLTGPKRTAIGAHELVTGVLVPAAGRRGASGFMKVGPRNAMVISVCSLAARLDPEAGVARVAIGAAAPTARRVAAAEPLLLDRGAAEAFGAAVADASEPIDDHRGRAAYRRHALGVLGRRLHRRLWEEAA